MAARVLILFSLFPFFAALGNVECQTRPVTLQDDSLAQQVDSMVLAVLADDFWRASRTAPIYLRLRLTPLVKLACTAVDISPDHPEYLPVFLGMYLKEDSDSRLVAAPDTVELLRMQRGEDQWWLRINTSSSSWVDRGGVLGPPKSNDPVFFEIGLMAEASASRLAPLWERGKANLPVQQDETGRSRHVPLIVETVGALEVDREGYDELQVESAALHRTRFVRTAWRPEDIDKGGIVPISFSYQNLLGWVTRKRMDRLMAHLTPTGRSYRTAVHVLNPTEVTQPVAFRRHSGLGYPFSGPGEIRLIAPGLQTLYPEFWQYPGSVEWLMGREVFVAASFARKRGSTWSGVVPELRAYEARFAMFFDHPTRFFDGLTFVNAGDEPASVWLEHVGRDGEILEWSSFGSLEPLAKELSLVSAPAEDAYAFSLLESTKPLGVNHLWGTLEEQVQGWCLDAVPVPLPLRPDGEDWSVGARIDRVIPLSESACGTPFSLLLHNGEREESTLELTLMDADGTPLDMMARTVSVDSRAWLDSPFPQLERASYVRIHGPPFVRAMAVFPPTDTGVHGGHIADQVMPDETAWYLVPPQGLARSELHLINPWMDRSPEVMLRCFDVTGRRLESRVMVSQLGPRNHEIRPIDSFPDRTAYFSVQSSEPCFKSVMFCVPIEDESCVQMTWPAAGHEGQRDPLDPILSIPDDALKRCLVNRFDGEGGLRDGEISKREAMGVLALDLSNQQIRDLTGLSHFRNLVRLDFSGNPLKAVPDLRDLSHLEELVCVNANLTHLPRLPSSSPLRTLDCRQNRIPQLPALGDLSRLSDLDCGDNPITCLDISGSPCLQRVTCNRGDLDVLRADDCASLIQLECWENRLTQLDVRGCGKLEKLNCERNRLEHLDLEGCGQLRVLNCSDNQLTHIDFDDSTLLTRLDCSSNALTHLEIGMFTELAHLDASHNPIVELDATRARVLVSLNLACARLEDLHVRALIHLQDLDCRENRLASLDLSSCISLRRVNCRDQALQELILPHAPGLIELDCSNNRIEALGFFRSNLLERLDCSNNLIEVLNVSDLPYIQQLNCSQNQLLGLNVLQCGHLEILNCSFNRLTRLTLPEAPFLERLECQHNLLRNIVMPPECHSGLRTLNCFDNQLTRLDPSWAIGQSMGKTIDCHGNGFDKGDCPTLQAIEGAQNIDRFIYNPQSDGSVLHCE